MGESFISAFRSSRVGLAVGELDRLAKEYLQAAERLLEEARSTVEDCPSASLYFSVRTARWILDMGFNVLKEKLARIAREHGGCASCRFSTPYPGHLSLLARSCKLGLAQDSCGRWEPLLEDG